MASAELTRFTEPVCIGGSVDQESPSNRRIHERLKANELEWLQGASVKYGAEAHVLNISAGGLLLETRQALKPNSSVVLELTGPDNPILVPSTVLRCRVASLSNILTYHGACAFKRPLTIPELTVNLTSQSTELAMSVAHAAEASVDWGKVVARFKDGRIVHGYTNDFDPAKAHLHVSSDLRDGESTIIRLSELKALFFVRDFAGDPTRVDDKFFSETPNGDRVEVTFWDDEVIIGSTQSYLAEGQGFFLQPADPRSNNLSVFVTAVGRQQVRFL
jgi:uncharacterized protein DUF6982/PilZ domain-containing protein